MRPLLLLALLAAPALAAPAGPERVVSGDGLIAATINGHSVRLRVEPGADGMPVVPMAAAPALGLKGGGLLGMQMASRIGRERVTGSTAVAQVGWEGRAPAKQRVGWMSRAYPMPADGTVGIGGLPEPVVRIVLGRPGPAPRTETWRMGGAGAFASWSYAYAAARFGALSVLIRFEPRTPRSTVNAPAGARLAELQGGTFTDERFRQEVAYGVERPLRTMALARPLALGPLTVARIAVRVTDGAGANTIAEPDADPAEVVVSGKGKRQAGIMVVGADLLAGCSSLVFDKPAKEVRLTCG